MIETMFETIFHAEKSRPFQHIVTKLLGKGLVWAEGEEHKRQRKLLGPAFTCVHLLKEIPHLY